MEENTENKKNKEEDKEENQDTANAKTDEKVEDGEVSNESSKDEVTNDDTSKDKAEDEKQEVKEENQDSEEKTEEKKKDVEVNKPEEKPEGKVEEPKKPEIKKPREKIDFSKIYNKYYKVLLLIPVIMLIISLGYLAFFQAQNGDIILKDITLSGGTSIQVNTNADVSELRTILEDNFEEVSVRSISDVLTGKQLAIVVETTAEVDEIRSFLEDYFGFPLTSENSSIEFTGSTLSDSFYNQLRFAMVISFIFMALIIFIIFRSFIPSIAVVFAAFADIVFTLSIVNLLGMRVSTAGIVAFIMLIGYSVDTDILLTTRVIKRREGSINSRIASAFKTGITMTLTSLLVVLIGLFMTSGFSKVFSQIFTILTIGLLFDIVNTWLFNAGIIKWYAEKTE